MAIFKRIRERLKYPHKWTALQYVWDDPKLLAGVFGERSSVHVGNFIERATDTNIVIALNSLLPQRFVDHCAENHCTDDLGYRMMLYLLVRKFQPETIVETGVARGISSAYILQAMQDNGKGHLYSIDLPARNAAVEEDAERKTYRYTLSDGQTHKHYDVGHTIPDYLRDRWTLILDDAKQALPKLLADLEAIDVFYHDSLHTYEHMKFEFETAWPYIREGGLLLSDDVLWNHAFHEHCKAHRKQPIIFRSFGMIRR